MFAYLRHLQKIRRSTDLSYARQLIASAPGRSIYALSEYMPRFIENYICDFEHIHSLEMPYELDLGNGRIVTCTPDAVFLVIDRKLFIDDYKSERWIRTGDQARKSFQGRFYSLCVADTLGFAEVAFRFQNMRYGVNREVTYSPEELEATRAELQALIRDLEQDKEFGPTPGNTCKNCPIARDCPAQSETPLDGDPTPFAESLVVREKALRDDKKILRSYIHEHGEVQIRKGTYGFIPITKKYLPAFKLIQYFENVGYSEADAISLCSADLSRVESWLKGQGKPGKATAEGLTWIIGKRISLKMQFNGARYDEKTTARD